MKVIKSFVLAFLLFCFASAVVACCYLIIQQFGSFSYVIAMAFYIFGFMWQMIYRDIDL